MSTGQSFIINRSTVNTVMCLMFDIVLRQKPTYCY